ncbi:MAG TPA: alpha/beta fold hydrolase [Rectinemataceae bacterium]
MRRFFILAALAAFMVLSCPWAQEPVSVSSLAGEWIGTLQAGGARLRIVFRVTSGEGGFTAVMDSPDQGAKGIPVSSASLEGSAIVFDLKNIGGRYEGTLDAAGGKIAGFWKQGGLRFPLDLVKQAQSTPDAPTSAAAQLAGSRRPQEPQPPFPYETREVKVKAGGSSASGGTGGFELAGTLCLPRGDGPFPSALLVTGSGQQDRDETIVGHKPFLVLADYLARRGIASLRLDDRGAGDSGGDFGSATTHDFAEDAASAIAFLRAQRELDPRRTGIIGHSEGGIVASMVAAKDPDLAFAVLLAGPGLPGEQILYLQNAAIARASGVGEQTIAGANATNARLYAIALSSSSPEDKRTAIIKIYKDMAPAGAPQKVLDALEAEGERSAAQLLSPWFRSFLILDPYPYLKQARMPLLALIGSKDLQVPADENLAAIGAALAEAGNPRSAALRLDGLNHLFQTADTGLPEEYGAIEETISPTALETIGLWLDGILEAVPRSSARSVQPQLPKGE